MKSKRNATAPHLSQSKVPLLAHSKQQSTAQTFCTCQPLADLPTLADRELSVHQSMQKMYQGATVDRGIHFSNQDMPVDLLLPSSLCHRLHQQVSELLAQPADIENLSLLALHIFQRVSTISAISDQRTQKIMHVTASIFEQMLLPLQRSIRAEDHILVTEAQGAALILPHVDQQEMYHIVERIVDRLSLLQAETIEPPLTRDTIIQIGIASYPAPSPTLEALFAQLGTVARSWILRPIMASQMQGMMPVLSKPALPATSSSQKGLSRMENQGIPFLDLPAILSPRLIHLLPYTLACELRCVPVGRHLQRLTVAMADPYDQKAQQRLQEITHMTIFPVACDVDQLNALLEKGW